MKITMLNAKELVMDVLKANLVPFIAGSPGSAKSSLARQIAEEHNLEFIDIRLSQLDSVDLNGFPTLKGKKAGYLPMDLFPLEGDPLPEGKNGFLILFDEFNSAALAVQAASYRVILDKEVGQHKLHPRAAIMAAGNLMTDKAIVNRMSTAMQSRLIHFELATDVSAFIKWADANGIDHRVKSFINFKPEALFKFDPNHTDVTFPCSRTWEFLSRLISKYPTLSEAKLPLLAGTVGEGMAREFFAFTKIYGELPNIEDIIKSPASVTLSSDPSVHYALSGLVSYHLSERNAEPLMAFLRRLNIDFQVIALRAAFARNQKLKESQAVKDWIRDNARELAI